MAKPTNQTQQSSLWSPIYPGTATFFSMTSDYGFDGLTIQDVPDLNDLINLSQDNTFGIILAYKYLERPLFENSDNEESGYSDGDNDSISLPCKPHENYCVTTALMDTLQNMNSDMEKVDKPSLEPVKRLSSIDRGLALESIPEVEETNVLDTSEPETPDLKNKDAYHFVSYIFKNRYIWELNGVNRCPTMLERVYDDEDENWLEMLQIILEDKIDSESLEAHIIAIIQDPCQVKEKKLKIFSAQIEDLENELKTHEVYPFKSSTSIDPQPYDLSSEGRELLRKKHALELKVIQLKHELRFDQIKESEEEQNNSPEVYYVGSSPSPSSSPSPPLSFSSTHETLSTDGDEDVESVASKENDKEENDKEENAIVSELEEQKKNDSNQDSDVPELTEMKNSDATELIAVKSDKYVSSNLDTDEVESTVVSSKEIKISVKRCREKDDEDEDNGKKNGETEIGSLKHLPAKKRFNLHK